MKLSLRLILFLVAAVTIVTFVVSKNEVRAEKRGLRTDLVRRAEILAESLQEIVEPALEKGSREQLRRIVERFGNREQLAGVAVYDNHGQLLAESSNLQNRFVPPPVPLASVISNNTGLSQFINVGTEPMHVYYMPLHDKNSVVGVLAIFHDVGYIETQSARMWRATFWHVVAEVLLIVLITVLIIRWTIVLPISRTAQWMKDIRRGRVLPSPPGPKESFLAPFTNEVMNLTRSLADARSAAEEEARLRESGESVWTAERLRVSIQGKATQGSLVVVSNREPYMHVHKGKEIELLVPASGLVTALEPILRACDGIWIASGSGDADRETVDYQDHIRVPPDKPDYTLRRVWLSKEVEKGHYYGFSNEGLWPLCHIAHTRPIFRASDWQNYQEANRKFAEAVLQEIEGVENPLVLVQDYHFALLPRMVKEMRPDARVAIFWHIPWPNPEAFGICPWQRELVSGLLGADLIGFQIQAHCDNFLETVDAALESQIEWERFAVKARRTSHIRSARSPSAWIFAKRSEARIRRCRPTCCAASCWPSWASRQTLSEWALTAWTTPRDCWNACAASKDSSRSGRRIAKNSRLCRSARPAARKSSAITISCRSWKRKPSESMRAGRRRIGSLSRC